MGNNKVLHILYPEKFFKDYIHFVNENFDPSNHLFLYLKTKGDEPKFPNVKPIHFYRIPILFQWELYRAMKQYDKVMLHSLAKEKVIKFLFFFPSFSKKCYWLLWGGDMYYRLHSVTNKRKGGLGNFVFSKVVSRLGYILTSIKGDLEIARSEFGFSGGHYECLLYPSNLFKSLELKPEPKSSLNILLGNSSHASNNHKEIIDRLSYLSNSDVKIYCPLSYGSKTVAKEVAAYGKSVFGDKFVALTKFLSLNEYIDLLGNIHVAVFNHWRQQGVGNIMSLLGMGKTVYLRREVTTWGMLEEKGLVVKAVEDLDRIELLDSETRAQNIEIVKEQFSKEVLVKQYKDIFQS